jgi:hypothetical protein
MNTLQFKWTSPGLISVAIAVATGTHAAGQVVGIVSPPSTANLEGNAEQTPILIPISIQHLIPASNPSK